jgi:hypothetical protein
LITTTTSSSAYVALSCSSSEAKHNLNVTEPYSHLTVYEFSPGTVDVTFDEIEEPLALVWLHALSATPSGNTDISDVQCTNAINSPITINDLLPSKAYIFCLVKINSPNTSPFNCQPFMIHVDNIWLQKKDILWVTVVVIIFLIIAILIGVAGMYITLSKHFKLINRNKSLKTGNDLKHNNLTGNIDLPKDYRNENVVNNHLLCMTPTMMKAKLEG